MGKGLNELWHARKKELKQNIDCSEYNQNDPKTLELYRKGYSWLVRGSYSLWPRGLLRYGRNIQNCQNTQQTLHLVQHLFVEEAVFEA